jgi:hypothetical protein
MHDLFPGELDGIPSKAKSCGPRSALFEMKLFDYSDRTGAENSDIQCCSP